MHISKFLLACTLLLAGLPALAAPIASSEANAAFTDPPPRAPQPRIPKEPERPKTKKGRRK